MIKYVYLALGFIVVIQIGAFAIEKGKMYYSRTLGYEGAYSPGIGRLSFSNPEMRESFLAVRSDYRDDADKYRNSPEWEQLIQKDQADRAMIEIAGKLITLFITALGLVVYLFRRNKGFEITWVDWLGVIFGLVFMRDVLINTFDLIRGNMLCQQAKMWLYFDLPVFTSIAIYNIFGLMLFFFIIFKLPKASRIGFIISGLVGTLIGGFIWLFYMGDLLL